MFSQRLRALRESDKLSQITFAEKIGFSQAAISSWENNTREPGIEALLRIARFFNVSVDYLVGNTTTFLIQESKYSLSKKEKEMLGYFSTLPAEMQSQLLGYAQFLTENNKLKRKIK